AAVSETGERGVIKVPALPKWDRAITATAVKPATEQKSLAPVVGGNHPACLKDTNIWAIVGAGTFRSACRPVGKQLWGENGSAGQRCEQQSVDFREGSRALRWRGTRRQTPELVQFLLDLRRIAGGTERQALANGEHKVSELLVGRGREVAFEAD